VTFRTRLLAGLGAVVLIPLTVMALGVRREMASRLTSQYEQRASTVVGVIRARLERESDDIAARLEALRAAIRSDNRFRAAAVQRLSAERPYLLDYAERVMRITGLSMLRIQDESGRILSSGHFRNEFDLREPELVEGLTAFADRTALVEARTAEGTFVALARLDSTRLGGRQFWLVGGTRVNRVYLGRITGGQDVSVSLVYPGGVLSSDSTVERLLQGALDETGTSRDSVCGSGSRGRGRKRRGCESPGCASAYRGGASDDRTTSTPSQRRRTLLRSVDRWFLTILVLTAGAALLLALWLASHLSRPLVLLARKTELLDLDRLTVDFASRRRDEIGELSRLLGAMTERLRALLGAMTERLRASATTLRAVERRAAMGDLARQVNHDVKNGLMPIRNILRHLSQVASEQPERLGEVFHERRPTLESSVAYLETLASKYARLSPIVGRQRSDVNAVIEQVVADMGSTQSADVQLRLQRDVPQVAGDTVALRRIVENLVGNARDSIERRQGTVSIETASVGGVEPRVQIAVRDTGRGMTREELDRAFDDFYTTKSSGTGLGLSIVRRLIMDLNGALRVESEPGVGTTVTVLLPLAAPTSRDDERKAEGPRNERLEAV
jgi:signal transduction histidine kinase